MQKYNYKYVDMDSTTEQKLNEIGEQGYKLVACAKHHAIFMKTLATNEDKPKIPVQDGIGITPWPTNPLQETWKVSPPTLNNNWCYMCGGSGKQYSADFGSTMIPCNTCRGTGKLSTMAHSTGYVVPTGAASTTAPNVPTTGFVTSIPNVPYTETESVSRETLEQCPETVIEEEFQRDSSKTTEITSFEGLGCLAAPQLPIKELREKYSNDPDNCIFPEFTEAEVAEIKAKLAENGVPDLQPYLGKFFSGHSPNVSQDWIRKNILNADEPVENNSESLKGEQENNSAIPQSDGKNIPNAPDLLDMFKPAGALKHTKDVEVTTAKWNANTNTVEKTTKVVKAPISNVDKRISDFINRSFEQFLNDEGIKLSATGEHDNFGWSTGQQRKLYEAIASMNLHDFVPFTHGPWLLAPSFRPPMPLSDVAEAVHEISITKNEKQKEPYKSLWEQVKDDKLIQKAMAVLADELAKGKINPPSYVVEENNSTDPLSESEQNSNDKALEEYYSLPADMEDILKRCASYKDSAVVSIRWGDLKQVVKILGVQAPVTWQEVMHDQWDDNDGYAAHMWELRDAKQTMLDLSSMFENVPDLTESEKVEDHIEHEGYSPSHDWTKLADAYPPEPHGFVTYPPKDFVAKYDEFERNKKILNAWPKPTKRVPYRSKLIGDVPYDDSGC